MSSEASLPQCFDSQTDSSSTLLEGILVVCLTRWDTICVPCHNGIVHSHH